MAASSDKYVSLAVLVVLFCPAIYGFVSAIVKANRGTVERHHKNFVKGMMIHLANSLLSPCIPAYLLYLDTKTGGGSMASLLSVPIIPATWILFVYADGCINKASTQKQK